MRNDTWAWEEQLRRERAIAGSAECPECGAMVFVEDDGALLCCENCGWLGRLSEELPEGYDV